MEATEMRAGMWIRNLHTGDPFCVVTAPDEYRGELRSLGGEPVMLVSSDPYRGKLDPHAPGWEPWAPRVGEWVRWEGTEVSAALMGEWRVTDVIGGCVWGRFPEGHPYAHAPNSHPLGEDDDGCRLVPCLAPLPENAGLHPAPVEPRGFAVGDRVRLNAKGRAEVRCLPEDERFADAVQAVYGVTLTRVAPNGGEPWAAWGAWPEGGFSANLDQLEHVPSAPVYSPPPPSGGVAEIEPAEPDAMAVLFGVEPPATCPVCMGPAARGFTSIACLAATCEPWREPAPVVMLGAHGRGPFWAEPFYQASGLGVEVKHPLQSEAVRLWRAKVEQGGRR